MTHPASGNATWQDYPSTATQINAAALENMELALDLTKLAYRAVSANTTANNNERLYVDASGAARTISAPASPVQGTKLFVKATFASSTNIVTLNWTIDGDATGVQLTATGAGVHLSYNGTAWFIDYVTPSSSKIGSGSAPASAGIRSGTYDSLSNVYMPKGNALGPVRGQVAKAAMNSSPQLVNLCALGDSKTAGSDIGDATPSSNWGSQIRNYLNLRGIPSAGTGLVMASNGTTLDSRIVLSGSWTNTNPYRAWGATGATATFTSDVSGSVVEVYYYTNSGTFTVKVGANAAVAVTPAGGGTNVARYQVPGQSVVAGTQIVVTSTSAAGYLIGFCVRGTTGLLIHPIAVGGYSTTQMAATGANTLQQIISFISPNILCLMGGAADPLYSIPVSTSVTNYNTILNTNNAGIPKFMLVESPVNSVSSQWPQYVSAQYDLADANSIPLIDTNDKIGTNAQGLAMGLLQSDQTHENTAGCNDLARQIANLLTA